MAKKEIDIQALQGELEQALALIKESSTTGQGIAADSKPTLASLANTDSLLERCAEIVNTSERGKPKLRIIRHLACSGGTLLSKCLAAMPNVYLLSELHPETTLHLGGGKAKFLPVDVATQARYARVPEVQILIDQIFVNSIVLANQHVQQRGGELLIRVHSHSDFCVGPQLRGGCAVSQLLNEYFDIKAIATVRHPIDAYQSLVTSEWVHFEPKSFEEYCRRVKAFIKEQDVVFSYDKFVGDPIPQMKAISDSLDIPFDESFIDIFDIFNVTGNSGRQGDVIAERSRKKLPESLEKEIKSSETYSKLMKIMETMELMDVQ
jgi:hypothetical protein